MYKCNCCENEFENLRAVKEIHYECTELPYEMFYECPLCGSGDCELKEETEEYEY